MNGDKSWEELQQSVAENIIEYARCIALRDGWLSVARLQRDLHCTYTAGSIVIDRLVSEGFLGERIPFHKNGKDLSPRRAVNW